MSRKSKGNSADPVTVQLRKFDMNWIKDNKIIIFIGKRNTGKSILVLDYLYHHRDFPLGTVISPTDNYNFTYRPHVPSIFIHEDYTPELLEQILKRQKDICKKQKVDPAYADVDPRTFVVLDDCLADSNEWVKDKNMKWIFMNGRHAKVTFMLTMQYCLGITPNLRTNVDYIFICKEPKLGNQRRLYEHYAGMFPCFEMFRVVLNKCTKDHGCLVIDNSSNSDRLEDQVFWYRSDIDKPDWDTFKLCYPIFWKNNEVFLAGKDNKKDNTSTDFTQLALKKNQVNFSVKQLTE
jgi:hypothetical protein